MSLEHSPARRNKTAPRPAVRSHASKAQRAPPIFSNTLLTRHEVGARMRCEAVTVTRNYQKWGLKPVRISGRVLFPSDQITALDRRLIETGDEA
jgi:hypothetical protein